MATLTEERIGVTLPGGGAGFSRRGAEGETEQAYSVEAVFDRIDSKFIDFYGEYGRRIVNTRRAEWNQDDVVNLRML